MISNRQNHGRHPKVGTLEYEQHIREEVEHYAEIFKEGEGRETLLQPVPASWHEAERRADALVQALTGNNLDGHMVTRLNRRSGVRMLSLGSGPCGVEIGFAKQAPLAEILCIDINDQLLDIGQQRASQIGLSISFEKRDLNSIELPKEEFDILFCHASLHHVLELERLAEQIKRSLRPDGELITVDVVTRNGYRMWPETHEVVRALWKSLPDRFRINHTSYPEPRVDDEILDVDHSEHGMECIRSQDILPVLAKTFNVAFYVPYFSLARRFFDTMYGPNYDLSAPLDRALFDWIWELDRYLLVSGKLRPETFFGIYRKTADANTNGIQENTKAAGLLRAYPNPIHVLDDSGAGTTTLVWSASHVQEVEVRLDSPDGVLFARSGPTSSKTTGKWVRNGMVFYLQNTTSGLSLTPENTLSKVEVKITTEQQEGRFGNDLKDPQDRAN